MSNKALTWALSQTTGSPTKKLVLLRLADQANDRGFCWPGKDSIARHCEVHKKTVQKALQELHQQGLIRIEHRKDDDGIVNLTSRYWLQIGVGAQDSQGGSQDSQGVGAQDSPNPHLEPSMNPKNPCPADAEASAEPSQKKPDRPRDPIWDTLMEVCGIDTSAIPKSARGGYNRAVKELREVGATPDQIKSRAQRWHKVYSGATLTPPALVKHWASLAGSQPKQQSEGRIPV